MTVQLSSGEVSEAKVLDRLTRVGRRALPPEAKSALLADLRQNDPAGAARLETLMFEQVGMMRAGLEEAQVNLAKLEDITKKLTEPPWFPGVFSISLPDRTKAFVWVNSQPRVVNVAEGVDAAALKLGDQVFLNAEMNVLVCKSPYAAPHVGETGTFARMTSEGRVVLTTRDQEVILEPTPALRDLELEQGDQIRWDRVTWIAYERVERQAEQEYLMTEVPEDRPDQIGGHGRIFGRLCSSLMVALESPKTAEKYQLEGRQTVLLYGPPGCGKTKMVRAAAAEITRRSGNAGKQCHVAVVKPGQWENPYVGMTQQKIRECFAGLRKAAETAHVLLYLDEVESIGRVRGGSLMQHGDKFLAALLAELDGFSSRGNVAIVAGTNRKELIDPALLERLSDIELIVGRPDMQAAREIFAIHLPESLPFSPNGSQASATREMLVERAVSRLYDPNAENAVSTMKLSDGTSRTISARELLSGRVIEQICRDARVRACERDMRFGQSGIQVEDIEEAVSEAIDRLATTLSKDNIRAYLTDVPQDLVVTEVVSVERRVRRSHRYLTQQS